MSDFLLSRVSKCRKSAFTLLEMLIVVAILAVLVALLLPAYNSVKQAGLRSACLANVKTMQHAYLTYVYDNSGFFPKRTQASINYYTELIPNYLPKELFCPLRSYSIRLVPNTARGFRYAINDNLRGYFTSISSVPCAPSRTVLVAEMYYMPDGFYSWSHLTDTSQGWHTGGHAQSHLNGLNLGFLDGHVENVKAPLDPSGLPNWGYPPVYGKNYKEGYYFHTAQFLGMSTGRLHW